MREIEFRVLAGILPDAIGRIETATLLSLGEDNFQDRNAAILWGFISEYYDDHSAVIPEWVLVQKAEKNGLDSATQVVLSELHRGLSALPVEEHEFKEAVKALKERELEERTAEVLTIGREILVDGYHDPSTDTTYRGHDDARSFVSESLQKLQVVGSEAAPEGEMRDDMEKIWKAFVEKADNPDDLGGIKYGLKDIDEVTGGIRPGELCLLAGFTGVGKASPLWTPVLTPTGWVKIGDLAVGDTVVDPLTGLPQSVTAVHDRGIMKTYKVTTRDGGSVITAADHLWRVQSQYQKDGKSLGDNYSILSTAEIMEGLPLGRRYYLPTNAPVEFDSDQKLPIGAYAMGVLLGDGGITVDVRITSNTQDEDEILSHFSNSLGIPHKLVRYRTGTVSVQGEGHGDMALRNALNDLGLRCKSVHKAIPDVYMFASAEDRLELVRGLMDTDGTVEHTGTPAFSTSSEKLMNDFRNLVHSLGGVTGTTRSKKPFYRDSDGNKVFCSQSYSLSFRLPGDINPFNLSRKRDLVKPQGRDLYRNIVSVEEVGEEPVRCITVSGDDHLYITEDYLVTHNSHIVVNLARNAMLAGKNVLMFTTETTREEMELRILARHSREPKFKRPRGLDSHEIMSATLSAEDTKVFREVLNDFRERAGGSLFMVQMPSSGSTDYVYAKANQYNRKAEIDLIIIDSINLLRLPRRYDSKREMLEDMLQAFKRFASAFDNGRGVGIASPWQMSRTAWKEAEEAGGVYSLASLADTSEAERCLPLDTGVLTPFGFVPIGSLVVGDTVVDPQGDLQSVQEIHDPGELPLYKVTTSDSFSVLTSPGHVWDFTDEEGFKDSLTTEAMYTMLNSEDVTVFTLPEMSSQADYHSKTWVDDQLGKLPVAYMVEVLKNTDVQAGQLVVPVEDPQMVSDYIRVLPRFAMIDDVEEPKHVRFHYDADMLKGEPYFEEVMRCNLLGGDPSKFKLDPYYLNLPRIFRLEFIERFLGVYGDITVDLTTKKDQRKYLPTLPYDHPSYGESLKEMVLSLGFTLDGEPRRVVSIEKTDTSAPVRCITVSGSLHEFIVDGFIPTHNSASQIITLYKEGSGDNTRLSMQVLKHRSGRELPKVTYPVDYRNSFIDTEGSSGNSADTQPSPNVRERGNLDFRSLMG